MTGEETAPSNETTTAGQLELENLRREVSDYKDKYMRLLAEGENSRKRLMKERDELLKHSSRSVVVDFLTPIDQMESALKFAKNMSEDVKHWAMGFEMILNHFKDVLSSLDVKEMHCLGKQYDPHLHHVTETVENDQHPPGTIVKESLKGYMMGEAILRPANVTVSKSKESRLEVHENENENKE